MAEPERDEIGKINAPSPLLVLAGAVVLTLLPVLLLGRSIVDLVEGSDGIAFVDPINAMAGLGFAGLWMALVGWGAWNLASGVPLTSSPGDSKFLLVASIVALVGLSLLAAGPLTTAYAKRHGFRRCAAADRFQAGNVKKNDVTLHAYVRLDTTDAALRARCDGATDPTISR